MSGDETQALTGLRRLAQILAKLLVCVLARWGLAYRGTRLRLIWHARLRIVVAANLREFRAVRELSRPECLRAVFEAATLMTNGLE